MNDTEKELIGSDIDTQTVKAMLRFLKKKVKTKLNSWMLRLRTFGRKVDLSQNKFDIVGEELINVCTKYDLTETDTEGRTYPMLAADACETELVKAMVGSNKTVNINQQDNKGWTLLTHTVHMVENNTTLSHKRIARDSSALRDSINFLCLSNADPDLPDYQGKTPRDHAKSLGIPDSFLPPPREIRRAIRVSHHDTPIVTNIPQQHHKCE